MFCALDDTYQSSWNSWILMNGFDKVLCRLFSFPLFVLRLLSFSPSLTLIRGLIFPHAKIYAWLHAQSGTIKKKHNQQAAWSSLFSSSGLFIPIGNSQKHKNINEDWNWCHLSYKVLQYMAHITYRDVQAPNEAITKLSCHHLSSFRFPCIEWKRMLRWYSSFFLSRVHSAC